MPVRMVVRVDAPRAHPDRLTFRDAFEHVLDLFDLAIYGEADPNQKVDGYSQHAKPAYGRRRSGQRYSGCGHCSLFHQVQPEM